MKILTEAKLLNIPVLCEYGNGLSPIGRFKIFGVSLDIVRMFSKPNGGNLYEFFYKGKFIVESLGHFI